MSRIEHNIRNLYFQKKGSTLAEMLVVMFIFSLMMGGIFTASAAGQDVWHTNKARVEVQQDLRKAMGWIKEDLRQAGPSSIVDVPADGVEYSQITFKRPSGVSGGSIVWEANAIEYDQDVTDSTLLERVVGASEQIIATNIKSISFKREISTPYLVEVAIVGEKGSLTGKRITYAVDFEVQLRND